LNYGNSDNCDFRFSSADCKRRPLLACSNQSMEGL